MNQLTRMLLAGMMFAAMTTSPTHAGAMISTGSMTAATTFVVTSGGGGECLQPASSNNCQMPAAYASAAAAPVKPAAELTESQLTELRTWITSELAKLGRDHAFAHDAASKLTPEDLAVLAANPKMMQPAGRLTTQQENLLWAVLIVAGIVALILAADSSSVTVNA